MGKKNQDRVASLPLVMTILAVFAATVLTQLAGAQSHSEPTSYDSIATDGESYAGPARGSTWDKAGSTVYIGLLAPLRGPVSAEGEALVVAANLALKDSMERPLPDGRHVELAIGDESGPAWGNVSDVILQLVLQKNVVALITSTDGNDTHVSEQVGNRIGVPILTLSSDATSTQIDIPWIFRMGASDTVQAETIAEDIYRKRGLKKVMVISDGDHDGLGGFASIRQAAGLLGAAAPVEVVLDPLKSDLSVIGKRVKADSPQAVVLWTRPDVTRGLLPMLREKGVSAVYLEQQAGPGETLPSTEASSDSTANSSHTWIIAARGENTTAQKNFATRYLQQTGIQPGAAASQAYDAVCLTVRALRAAGPNRAGMRDQLARTRNYSGASGIISFDREGNDTTQIYLVALPSQQPQTKTRGGAE